MNSSFFNLVPILGIGALTGICSGLFGVGGGIVLVPILILFYKYTPQAASGTSLVALLLPVGLLGVIEYYKSGKITSDNIRFGLLVAVGLFFGTFVGARIAAHLPSGIMQRVFAAFLVLIAVRLWFAAAEGVAVKEPEDRPLRLKLRPSPFDGDYAFFTL
jgi:uncharacterized membrane protein YfcA